MPTGGSAAPLVNDPPKKKGVQHAGLLSSISDARLNGHIQRRRLRRHIVREEDHHEGCAHCDRWMDESASLLQADFRARRSAFDGRMSRHELLDEEVVETQLQLTALRRVTPIRLAEVFTDGILTGARSSLPTVSGGGGSAGLKKLTGTR